MLLDVKVDDLNSVKAALATFKASFSGFPEGSSLTSAHVNRGAMGSAGPIVIDLAIKPGQVRLPEGAGSFITTVPISPALANQFISNASAFYFQVDMARMPGALLGQFAKVIVTYSSPQGNQPVKRYRAPTPGDL